MIVKLKKWALSLKHNLYALYLAYHREDVPFIAKVVAVVVVTYALSPIGECKNNCVNLKK